MGKRTKISWASGTWNFLRGCSRTIVPGASTTGCGDQTGGGCYAERNGGRFCGPGLPYEGLVRITAKGARWTGKVAFLDDHLLDPLRWSGPSFLFTASVSDPFHEKLEHWHHAVMLGIMAVTPQHTHLLLTKRASRMRAAMLEVVDRAVARGQPAPSYCFATARAYVAARVGKSFTAHDLKVLDRAGASIDPELWPLPNVWPMVSVEHQLAADYRMPDLMETPAARIRGISAEPLLGSLDLSRWLRPGLWCIAGAESGPGARPVHPSVLRGLRDQCRAAGAHFWIKQAVIDEPCKRCGGRGEIAEPMTVGQCPLCRGEGGNGAIRLGPGAQLKMRGLVETPYLDGAQHVERPEAEESNG